MSYHTVIVPMDLSPVAEPRVKLAADLADRFDGRLIGVAAQPFNPPVTGDAMFFDPRLVEDEQHRTRDELAQAEAVFRRGAGTRNNIEWRSAIEAPATYLAEQARAADLVVVSRQGESDPLDWRFGVSPGEVLMSAGRPVLVVPPHIDYLSARRILIAWKDTREARRAVWDALPLLKAAEEVFVVAVGPETNLAAAEDVAEYLVRHGIDSTTTLHREPAASVADKILEMAEWDGADLIISGAYGHSRLREWMFGGVTRELLNRAPVCCLMSH
jgi:nucleotide-binding universal stress UspA family protein